ncbi:MAG TPA: RNA pseudouridine synthase [Candidatus Paceibacterota bacterium]|mgnify:CR=1 FL=1|nr:RNA pseudouridine synthase [Candidatus Paceibacterota bacterium]
MPEIIAVEKDFIIVNKPAGLVVHPDGRSKEGSIYNSKDEKTLCDFLLEKFPEIKNVGEPLVVKILNKNPTADKKSDENKNSTPAKKIITEKIIDRPGIVHRLDRETSGIMIVARNQDFFEYIKNQFKNREVKKTYHAFVYGNIKQDFGTIDVPIARNRKDFRQWFAGEKSRGESREALTEFKVLKRAEDKSATLIEVYPKTGRTHQIRVHMKHIYHPIIADTLYAPDRPKLFDFKRTALHSRSINFTDMDGVDHFFSAEYPDDFAFAVKNI